MPDNDNDNDIDRLTQFVERCERLAILTGAGCSAASGIPEYRDDDGEWKHARPVQYADFVASEATRRRYWARSFVGWQRVAAAEPNVAHRALADLDAAGRVEGLITQNVDNLHRRAGSRTVIDLHGILADVRCLHCEDLSARENYQERLRAANPGFSATGASVRPDGDTELPANLARDFVVPACERCCGVLKPDVVFFGESVPRDRVASARDSVARADALLVVGSSLMVFSGFRFVRQAADAGKPVAILNRGRTRGDPYATLRVRADCGVALEAVTARLGGGA